jgi:hypothetical protein
VSEGLLGLAGKAVDQVEVDALEAHAAGGGVQLPQRRLGLDPPDTLLNPGIEVLHPEAQPLEADGLEEDELLRAGHPGVDLDGELGLAPDDEVPVQQIHQPIDPPGAQEVRGASAPVDLDRAPRARFAETEADHLESSLASRSVGQLHLTPAG